MIIESSFNPSPQYSTAPSPILPSSNPSTPICIFPLISERSHNRRWDGSKLHEFRKRLITSKITVEDVDDVAANFLDDEIADVAMDWLGNTVRILLFEKCSAGTRLAMLERVAPHLAMIGINRNGTWAAQKIIECVQTPEEVALVTQNLRPYVLSLLLDQFGNHVVQCCLRFGSPTTDFLFEAMDGHLWRIAQGLFGARSMRACLESSHVTVSQQHKIATAIIRDSISLATNLNSALLLTWLLDTSNFPSRYSLLARRFTPRLSHLCTHDLASLAVLRIVNQKVEPEASARVVEALFQSPNDRVLTDVLSNQVNGSAVVHKLLTSPFVSPEQRVAYAEVTKRVLIKLKAITIQAYHRLVEEVGLLVAHPQPTYSTNVSQPTKTKHNSDVPGLPAGYLPTDQESAFTMAALQMDGQSATAAPRRL
ncbi:uncharacterized protein PHACADRAFT_86495 [Phanerochaete carnosa HHB-10118-sp]|uniref:PUM-HD domain-containing protein n=1 Tax=Phanerochaete carnosa (strain HHB-10118-sp) TaxID=650164 RepID=K5W606_PHACS|nr:uncharacterized protein PHACADRAFT_86495 [Phanerochaete carnosa HHB-10118-sp]EKM59338.1 hypothetical protein PHACADRAFT_86495 [Phanerochaete carnosa HHB-10118-sp]